MIKRHDKKLQLRAANLYFYTHNKSHVARQLGVARDTVDHLLENSKKDDNFDLIKADLLNVAISEAFKKAFASKKPDGLIKLLIHLHPEFKQKVDVKTTSEFKTPINKLIEIQQDFNKIQNEGDNDATKK